MNFYNLYADKYDLLNRLTYEELGRLFKAFLYFLNNQETEIEDLELRFGVPEKVVGYLHIMMQEHERSATAYNGKQLKKSQIASKNAKKRWESKNNETIPNNATACNGMQPHANDADDANTNTNTNTITITNTITFVKNQFQENSKKYEDLKNLAMWSGTYQEFLDIVTVFAAKNHQNLHSEAQIEAKLISWLVGSKKYVKTSLSAKTKGVGF